jgi:glucose-1-phosphate cytidylyltransferase
MCYGDHLADVNISALVEYHRSHERLATVTTAPHMSQFGVITTDRDGRATAFREKPTLDGAISIGFFVLSPGVFDYLGGDDCIFERTPVQRLVEDGELMTFHHNGFHAPMDTYRDYDRLCGLWNDGTAPWKTWNS